MWRQFFPLALLGLGLCLASAGRAEASTSENAILKSLKFCKKPGDPANKVKRPFGACYVSETKAAVLLAQVTSLSQALKSDSQQQQRLENQLRVPNEASEDLNQTICSYARIHQITGDVSQVASLVWSFSNRLRNVSEADVLNLSEKKDDLVQRLGELQVFTGPVLTHNPVILHTFKKNIEDLEHGFNTAMKMLRTERPVRPPIEFKLWKRPASPPASALSTRPFEPASVVAMYAGNLSNFNATLEYIQSQPELEQQILGYVELGKEMMKRSHRNTFEFMYFASQVKRAKDQLTSSVSDNTRSKLTQLTEESILRLALLVMSKNHTCRIRNIAYSEDLFTGDIEKSTGYLGHESGILTQSDTSSWLVLAPWNGGPLFQIYSKGYPLYASDRTHDAGRRYVLRAQSQEPSENTLWKFVPLPKGRNRTFRIFNVHYDEVLFADPVRLEFEEFELESETYRRVFLKKESAGAVEMETNADVWEFQCRLSPVG